VDEIDPGRGRVEPAGEPELADGCQTLPVRDRGERVAAFEHLCEQVTVGAALLDVVVDESPRLGLCHRVAEEIDPYRQVSGDLDGSQGGHCGRPHHGVRFQGFDEGLEVVVVVEELEVHGVDEHAVDLCLGHRGWVAPVRARDPGADRAHPVSVLGQSVCQLPRARPWGEVHALVLKRQRRPAEDEEGLSVVCLLPKLRGAHPCSGRHGWPRGLRGCMSGMSNGPGSSALSLA